MYLTDVMHGDELGNWKAALIHLLRVLYALGGDRIQEFNRRYASEIKRGRKLSLTLARFRQVPTFGRSTIRRFGKNVSGLKKLAARDYEDILQVSSPGLNQVCNPELNCPSASFPALTD